MAGKVTNARTQGRIEWLSDLIRLEIALWNRVDAALKCEHDLPLTFFESLHFIGRADGGMRVGELAQALRVTVGGTSKLVDRIERAGLIRREADGADRRASRLVLTQIGERTRAAAGETYAAELAAVLDSALSADKQQLLHALVQRLMNAVGGDAGESRRR